MLTVVTIGLAVFLLGVALVLAVASMCRLALRAVGVALLLGVAGAAFAVVGDRRYERCIDREVAHPTGRLHLTPEQEAELRASGQDTGPYVDRARCERGAAFGL